MSFPFYGITDIGYGRTVNEDYCFAKELDKDTVLLIIADGAGSHNEEFQPAIMICNEIYDFINSIINLESVDYVRDNVITVLKLAINVANRNLGAFKLGNEEKFGGYAASVTCCLVGKDNLFAFAHSGNTRLYLLRDGLPDGIHQLTVDYTKGYKLVQEGVITNEQYYTHPDRLVIESGVGFGANPEIQTFKGRLKSNDKLLLTTDGIHYAIRSSAISEIIRKTDNLEQGCTSLVMIAKELKYIDNASALMLINVPVETKEIVHNEVGDKLKISKEDLM